MAALNAQLEHLVELIGLPMALRLVDKFGGVAIYLPHHNRVKIHGPVAQVIGVEAAQKLSLAWPQEHVMVPMGAGYLRRQRDAALRADLQLMSVRAVALKYELTERQVYYIQASPDGAAGESASAATDQGSLF